MTYESAASFAQTWGLIYFIAAFVAVLAYALWPRNKEKFEKAARMPLDEEEGEE